MIRRFLDLHIPIETCNLRCHYCYITQQRKFDNKLEKFPFSPKTIRKALSKKRLGGSCLLNMCAGGETLLSGEVIELMRELLDEGHYLSVVTNGTMTNRFEQIAKFPKELIDHIFFKFSYHYLEFKRLNWLDKFFSNIKLMRDSGASFTVELTPNDELMPYMEELKQKCLDEVGAMPHVTIARDDRDDSIPVLSKYSLEEFVNNWKNFDSEMLNFKSTIFGKKRSEYCYAGDWVGWINLWTGDLRPCNCGPSVDNIFKNIDKPLNFHALGKHCSIAHCYNGHVWLTLGAIPEMESPTYAMLRNRICKDGSEWLKPTMKQVMSTKLKNTNMEYSSGQKARNEKRYKFYKCLSFGKRAGKWALRKLGIRS